MDILFLSFAALFGVAVGSFLNVVILRHAREESIGGRSHCPYCNKILSFFELIPLLSYLLQRGRCRACKAALSWQYPAVEALTALLFVAVVYRTQDTYEIALMLPVVYLLVCITVYDFRHFIIPNSWVYSLSVLSFLSLFLGEGGAVVLPTLLELSAGPLIALPFAALWYFSSGRWIGFGDAKLALAMGWLLGVVGGFSAVMLAFWIGAVASLTLLGIQRAHLALEGKPLTMKSEVPFAPFLILGLLLVYFFNINAFTLFV